jgi:hypothetical protein
MVFNMNSAAKGLKTFVRTQPYHLADLEEARDILIKVVVDEDLCIAFFKFGAVALPLKLADRLKDMIGKRCAVLRFEASYRIRCLDGENHAMSLEDGSEGAA